MSRDAGSLTRGQAAREPRPQPAASVAAVTISAHAAEAAACSAERTLTFLALQYTRALDSGAADYSLR